MILAKDHSLLSLDLKSRDQSNLGTPFWFLQEESEGLIPDRRLRAGSLNKTLVFSILSDPQKTFRKPQLHPDFKNQVRPEGPD
jgi:hypothetical protein